MNSEQKTVKIIDSNPRLITKTLTKNPMILLATLKYQDDYYGYIVQIKYVKTTDGTRLMDANGDPMISRQCPKYIVRIASKVDYLNNNIIDNLTIEELDDKIDYLEEKEDGTVYSLHMMLSNFVSNEIVFKDYFVEIAKILDELGESNKWTEATPELIRRIKKNPRVTD